MEKGQFGEEQDAKDGFGTHGIVGIFRDMHLDSLRSESGFRNMHTDTVISAGLSGIQCGNKHNAP